MVAQAADQKNASLLANIVILSIKAVGDWSVIYPPNQRSVTRAGSCQLEESDWGDLFCCCSDVMELRGIRREGETEMEERRRGMVGLVWFGSCFCIVMLHSAEQ